MNKNIFKNAWILAGILLLLSILLAALVQLIAYFLAIGSSSLSSIAGILSAFFVGQIYATQFKELMSSKLRLHVTVITSLVQIVLGLVYVFIFSDDVLLLTGLLVGITLFYALFIYLMLGFGGTSYLRAQEKAASAASSARAVSSKGQSKQKKR